MAGDRIAADLDGMGQAVQKFSSSTDTLQALATTFLGSIRSHGKPWGADEFGQAFSAKYDKPAQDMLDLLGVTSSDGMPNIPTGIADWLTAYSTMSQAEADAAAKFLSGLG
ncbi:MAG: hypothetical protein ACJ73S_15875 [Mycobacteriales bacterium]